MTTMTKCLCATRSFGYAMTLFLAALLAPANASAELSGAALEGWMKGYEQAWESRDADQAAALFAADATYQVSPFETPHLGPEGVRKYWAEVTAAQRNVAFDWQVLAHSGDTGLVHWSAQFDIDGQPGSLKLDGVFVLDFDAEGKCRRLREWWHLQEQPAP